MQAHGVGNEQSAIMMMELARSLTRSEAFEEVRNPKSITLNPQPSTLKYNKETIEAPNPKIQRGDYSSPKP